MMAMQDEDKDNQVHDRDVYTIIYDRVCIYHNCVATLLVGKDITFSR